MKLKKKKRQHKMVIETKESISSTVGGRGGRQAVSLWRVMLILQIALPDEEWGAAQQENIHH